MDDMLKNVFELLLSFAGGGGLVALISWLKDRRREKNDITNTNIETAIRLKDEAIKEYQTAEAKLAKARELLNEVEDELYHAKNYIDTLQDILRKHDVDFPEFETHRKGVRNGGLNGTSSEN